MIDPSEAMQLCAGQKSGNETAIHAMYNIFKADRRDAPLLVVALNDFNSLNKAAALNKVRQRYMFNNCYLRK